MCFSDATVMCCAYSMCERRRSFSQNGFSYRTGIKQDIKEIFWGRGSEGRYVAL